MKTARRKQQAGITFSGFIVGAFLLVAVTLFGFKLIPAYMEDAKIQHIFDTISHDPDMQRVSAREVIDSYNKRAAVEGINAIQAADLEVDKAEDGRPILSASYVVKVKVAGNVSLLLDFHPVSAGK